VGKRGEGSVVKTTVPPPFGHPYCSVDGGREVLLLLLLLLLLLSLLLLTLVIPVEHLTARLLRGTAYGVHGLGIIQIHLVGGGLVQPGGSPS